MRVAGSAWKSRAAAATNRPDRAGEKSTFRWGSRRRFSHYRVGVELRAAAPRFAMAMPRPDEEAIFHVARRLETPEARRHCLRQFCGDDAELEARVEALLRVHDEERSFLQSPANGLRAAIEEPPLGETPGGVLGPYKL